MFELLGSNFALNHFLWLNLSLVPWLSVFFLSILNSFHCAIPAAYVYYWVKCIAYHVGDCRRTTHFLSQRY